MFVAGRDPDFIFASDWMLLPLVGWAEHNILPINWRLRF